MARPWYRVRVQVGPKTWVVTSTDDPAPGPVLPLTFGWAVPDNSLGFPAQPDPASASLMIAAPTPDHVAGIDIGSPVAVSAWLHDPATLATNLVTNPSMEAAGATVEVARNLMTNPSLEVNTDYWAAWGGTGGAASGGRSTDGGYVGSSRYTIAWTTASASEGGAYIATPFGVITPGVTYSGSAWIRTSRTSAYRAVLEFQDAGGIGVGGAQVGAYVTATAGVWTRITVTGIVAPANASRVFLTTYGQTGNVVGDVLDVDAIMVNAGGLIDYFDGSTAAAGDFTYAWTGTAHASASVKNGVGVAGYEPTAAVVHRSVTRAHVGNYSMQVIPGKHPSFDPGVFAGAVLKVPVTATKVYTLSAWIYSPTGHSLNLPPDNLVVTASSGNMGNYPIPAGVWTRVWFTGSSPTDTTAYWFFRTDDNPDLNPFWVDGVMVTETPTEVPYFDGDTPGAAWTGTPHASTSVNVAPAATGTIAAFAGRVAEIRARPDLTHGTVYQLTCLDYTVDLSATLVGGTAWPAETAEARSDRILAEAGKTPPAGLAPDPGGSVAARDASATSARDLLLETLAHGVTADKARWIVTSDVNAESGALDVVPYSYRPVRRAVYAIDVLDPCVIDVGVEWVRSRRSAADWITIDHPGGPTIYGNPTGVPLPPLKTDQTNPATLAAFLLDNVAGYAWDGGTLRLYVHHPDAAPFWGLVAGWFDYGLGRAVVVPDIPAPQAPGGTTRYSGMIAAARFTIPTDGRPVVDFRLRADVPNDSYQTTRWSDVPVGTTWANINAATTWDDYEPGNTSGGAGTLTTRWADVPVGTTWETYAPSLTWFDHRTIPKP